MARQLALVEEEVAAMGLLADLATSDDARALRREAIALADRSGLLEQQYRLLHAQARTELDADRWAVARALVEEAAGLAHTLRQRLSADEYSGLRLRMKPMAIGGLSAGTMAPDLEPMARAEWLWRQFEVQRGWGVDQASSDVSRPADFHTLRGLLAGSAGPDGLDQATLRRTERLRMKLEGAERSRAPAAWPSLDQVQAGMREDSVMFVLLTDEPQSAALLVRPNQVELHLLASATQLESALDAVVRGLGRQDPLGDGALRARLAHLSDLLAPVLDALGGQERVQFLPGAGLEPLPLELLLQASSAPVSVLRLSSETLQQPRLAPSDEGDRGVLILQADSSSGDAVVADWTDLPAVGAEVDALKAMLPTGPVRHHRGIAAARTLDQLDVDDPLRLIHVASHALPAPYWSSLDLLAFGSGPEAQVPMGSLRQQRLQAELVVLSACRTALGGRGEMGLGFAQGFLAAGARQVLATAWPVDDRATAEFMNHFYQAHLLDGLEPAAALLRAQERMQAQQRWRAPYWWAGFQLWQGLPYDRQTPVMDGSAGLALRGKVSPNPVLR
jgi:CHAT domain-containing protein